MNPDAPLSCQWAERVSALLDHELPSTQEEMVLLHARSCSSCTSLLHSESRMASPSGPATSHLDTAILKLLPERISPRLRIMLAVIGILILIGSTPSFVRGNINGNALHELRHLAIWQVTLGAGVLSAAISFRISRLLTVMMVTFLTLTLFATMYDLWTGHSGPWTDPLHIGEIVATLFVLKLVFPYIRIRPHHVMTKARVPR